MWSVRSFICVPQRQRIHLPLYQQLPCPSTSGCPV
jgi:hypothetical protein